VLAGASPVGLAVDSVRRLVSIDMGAVETGQAQLASKNGERLRGAFEAEAGDVVKVLDIWPLLQAAFTQASRPARRVAAPTHEASAGAAPDGEVQRLVAFEAAAQEFALPLADVEEIIQLPQHIARAPRAESLVVGVASHRNALLPLLSLRGLLGLSQAEHDIGREKVLVVRIGSAMAGLVVDAMRALLPADAASIEPMPPMLAARTGGESRIAAIYRGEGGRRLISILSKDQLFREDVMERVRQAGSAAATDVRVADAGSAELQFIVFRLAEEEFALPIAAVEEVARAPEQITRVPKAPKFLEGVINLRGDVLPVVDQRRRFDMPEAADRDARRLLVVRTDRHRAGLIVDAVSEVLRCSEKDIEPAPDLTGETQRLVNGVLNLERAGRLVLLLDPAELLSRSERSLLDAFQADTSQAGS
jgi:purine-binding chemotaxis protein CheW